VTTYKQRINAIAEAGKRAIDEGYPELMEHRHPGTKARLKRDVEAVERWTNKLFYGKLPHRPTAS